MGGLLELLAVAAAILIALLLIAFLVGRLFHSEKVRKRIIVGAIALYVLAFLGYFGFIAFVLSGNLN